MQTLKNERRRYSEVSNADLLAKLKDLRSDILSVFDATSDDHKTLDAMPVSNH